MPNRTLQLVPVVVGVAAGVASAQNFTHVARVTITGSQPSESFGFALDGAGDVDGDGLADIIVGAVDATPNGLLSGAARVFSGLDGSLIHDFEGSTSGDQFGYSVAGLGDLNGDGRSDLAIGAVDANGFDGTVRVHSGLTGNVLFEVDGLVSSTEGLGFSLSAAGDVNNDGTPDLVIGAVYANNSTGRARVVSGIDGSTLYTYDGPSLGAFFGASVSAAGDVDDDGYDDFAISAPRSTAEGFDSGRVRVYSGRTGGVLRTLDGVSYGNTSGEQFGFAVDLAGDVDNDGTPDLVISAVDADINATNAGNARVFSGATGAELFDFEGTSFSQLAGQDVAGVGDVNSDGFDDVIIGLPGDTADNPFDGGIRVLSGADGSILYDFRGDQTFEQFGRTVAGVDDVNGDGVPDFAVGADRGGIVESGDVRIFISTLVGDANFDDTVDLADFGILRANFGETDTTFAEADFNQDGTVDLADFGLLRANFGSSVGARDLAMMDAWAATVPEPAIATSLIGLLALRRRARR
ncbi:MAG: dockerin type I domain-containing protein [Planctomycetota bacterium]